MIEIELASRRRARAPRERQWNALVGDDSPFLEWEWLASLEEAGVRRRAPAGAAAARRARGGPPRRRLPALPEGAQRGRVRLRPRLGRRRRSAPASPTTRSCWSACRSRRSPARASWSPPGARSRALDRAARRARCATSAARTSSPACTSTSAATTRSRRCAAPASAAPRRAVPLAQRRLRRLRRLSRAPSAASAATRSSRERRELAEQGVAIETLARRRDLPTRCSSRCTASTSRPSRRTSGAGST